jgi:hypothetical protein
MKENMQYLSISFWLISFSHFIHFLAKNIIHSSWLNNTPLCVYVYFLYPFVSLWTARLMPLLGCCEKCWNENGRAGLSVVLTSIPLELCPEPCGSSVFGFLINLHTGFHSAVLFYVPTSTNSSITLVSTCLFSWWQPFWLGWRFDLRFLYS